MKEELRDYISRKEDKRVFDELLALLTEWRKASGKPVVMMIDEVDTATNNQVFLGFLEKLKTDYPKREDDPDEKTSSHSSLPG